MNYRTLGRTGLQVSEIGLGCEHLQGKEYRIVKAVTDEAFELGVNIFDIFMSEPQIRTDIGKAIAGRRDKVIIQGHLGATWKNGQYARRRNVKEVNAAFCDLLARLNTDYIDIGIIHHADTEKDIKNVFESELIDYICGLKEKGIIRAIGLGSHSPDTAKTAVETGLIDILMFSLNPAFDVLPHDMGLEDMLGEEAKKALQGQLNPKRTALYHACEKHGTAITVMKGYMGGRLLDAKKSPFGKALTTTQCLHFALTRPAVASVLVGCVTQEELKQACSYISASEEERDFSEVFSTQAAFSVYGKCVYCNHCLPCPSRIDIALVNKYLDIQTATGTAAKAYNAMPAKAGDCTACGQCEKRCPFAVPVIRRMEEATKLFK